MMYYAETELDEGKYDHYQTNDLMGGVDIFRLSEMSAIDSPYTKSLDILF